MIIVHYHYSAWRMFRYLVVQTSSTAVPSCRYHQDNNAVTGSRGLGRFVPFTERLNFRSASYAPFSLAAREGVASCYGIRTDIQSIWRGTRSHVTPRFVSTTSRTTRCRSRQCCRVNHSPAADPTRLRCPAGLFSRRSGRVGVHVLSLGFRQWITVYPTKLGCISVERIVKSVSKIVHF